MQTVVYLFAVICCSYVEAKKPNILLILADDMGYQDAGFRGSDILTPNIDRLAKGGVILENHYVMPICSATRSSLMSGRYALRTGFWKGNIQSDEEWGLKLNETTMPEMLKRNGYATHGTGKWHCGMYTWDHTPAKRGFDTFLGLYLGAQTYYTHEKKDTFDFREAYYNETGFVDHIRKDLTGVYNTDIFTDRAKSIIESHDSEKPLFMYLAYTAPHGPLQVPENWQKYTKHMKKTGPLRKRYASMISHMDNGIGQVVDHLEKYNLRDNTIILFSSDNGALFPATGSNYPLRGGKGSVFEGGVRAVSFVNSPLLEKTGYVNTNLHHVVDWYKTFQEMAGDDPESTGAKTQLPLDGFNIWKSISRNETSPRQEVLINMRSSTMLDEGDVAVTSVDDLETPEDLETDILDKSTDDFFVLRWKNWKLFTGGYMAQGWTTFNKKGRSTGKTKDEILTGTRLFDLSSDPREEVNVADKYPSIVKRMSEKSEGYLKKMVYIGPRSTSDAGKQNGVWMPWVKN